MADVTLAADKTPGEGGVKGGVRRGGHRMDAGQPKAITAGKIFAAEIGRIPFQLSRKMLARLLIRGRIAENVGCRFVVTDAKSETASFYEKQGVVLLDSEGNQSAGHSLMFLDLMTV